MIAVVQRVTEARVTVEGRVVGEIGAGLLVLVAVEKERMESFWEAPVYNRYASREFGVIASECPRRCGLHVMTDSLVVEIVWRIRLFGGLELERDGQAFTRFETRQTAALQTAPGPQRPAPETRTVAPGPQRPVPTQQTAPGPHWPAHARLAARPLRPAGLYRLRRMPWRRRQGQHDAGRAEPHRRHLAPRRRHREHRRHHPARPQWRDASVPQPARRAGRFARRRLGVCPIAPQAMRSGSTSQSSGWAR